MATSKAINVSLLGDRQLQRALERMHITVQRKVMRKAFRSGAKIMQREAKRRAPRDTGVLRKTIKVRSYTVRRGDLGIIVRTGTRKEMNLSTSRSGYYPAAVEYGSKSHLARGTSPTSGQAEQPYLRPALESKRQEVIDEVIRFARQEIAQLPRRVRVGKAKK